MNGWRCGASRSGEDGTGQERQWDWATVKCKLDKRNSGRARLFAAAYPRETTLISDGPAKSFVDQTLVALKSAIHAEGFNPRMLEALAKIDRLQCIEKHIDKRLGRNLIRDPRAAFPVEKTSNAIRGWQRSNGKSARGGLEKGVGQSLMA